ncbi:MAG: hypothetical protein AVDCRST_MAG77-1787 [uncultured Chloroflexi bacterium]|uniref:Uncharacterized protein n=1 Tax=uncultured Chloroflexota bacterium TaxID=166587 RepID=A0A6J4I8E0_9CHLR|nr:MAG: hypothetical protein AVDCRST_MAG77-1787 [uncultured Chloroflexota bacterium]
MSRGLGALQRRVLDFLREHDGRAALSELAAAVLDAPVERSRLVSLRRAVRSLEAHGRVRVSYVRTGGETGAARGVGLHVALERSLRRSLVSQPVTGATRAPARWAHKAPLALAALARIEQQDVALWLARARTAKGYGPRRDRVWDLPPAEPPWIPYQLAARTMAAAVGAARRGAPLPPNVSRSVRRIVERAARDGVLEVREERLSLSRKYSALRVANRAGSSWRESDGNSGR